MCRNIKTLYNFDPPATEEEIRETSLQFVRKISGFRNPSQANKKAFQKAVQRVSLDMGILLNSLSTTSKPRDRKIETTKARARAEKRFAVKNK